MQTALIVAATRAIAEPALALQSAPAAAPAPVTAGAQGVSGLADGMAVVSSHAVRVTDVRQLYRRTSYGPTTPS